MNKQVNGHEVYTSNFLRIYDHYFFGYVSRLYWRCPAKHVVDHYSGHVTDDHLDVGVGTGYCLDRCRFPGADPQITLMDLSQNCLDFASKRLARYAKVRTHVGSVLEPQPFAQRFGSIAINYILAVLPGSMEDKGPAVSNMAACLRPDGVLFGCTPLYDYAADNRLARWRMDSLERQGLFSIRGDDETTLARLLANSFDRYEIRRVGCVAFFSATGPKGAPTH